MARTFVKASTQYLERDSTPVTGYPYTAHILFKPVATNATGVLWCICDKDAAADHHLAWCWSDGILYYEVAVGGLSDWSDIAYAASTWQRAICVGTSATSRTMYLDGVDAGANITNKTPAGMDRLSIGRDGDTSPAHYFNGDLAEFALWNVVLDAAERGALDDGIDPRLIRPASLVEYVPIIGRYSPEINWKGVGLTLGGSPAYADHPRVLSATGADAIGVAVPAGGLVAPSAHITVR